MNNANGRAPGGQPVQTNDDSATVIQYPCQGITSNCPHPYAPKQSSASSRGPHSSAHEPATHHNEALDRSRQGRYGGRLPFCLAKADRPIRQQYRLFHIDCVIRAGRRADAHYEARYPPFNECRSRGHVGTHDCPLPHRRQRPSLEGFPYGLPIRVPPSPQPCAEGSATLSRPPSPINPEALSTRRSTAMRSTATPPGLASVNQRRARVIPV